LTRWHPEAVHPAHEECDDYPIPAGKILFVTNVIADFDMPATSSGTAAVRFTPVGPTAP